jgi:hypothetical protein
MKIKKIIKKSMANGDIRKYNKKIEKKNVGRILFKKLFKNGKNV